MFRLEEMSFLDQIGGEELSCSDWKREVVLFRLEERRCLVQIEGEELSCSDWVEDLYFSVWRRGVFLFQT